MYERVDGRRNYHIPETQMEPQFRRNNKLNTMQLIERNIKALKREIEHGVRIDPAMVTDLERQYRELCEECESLPAN